MRIFEMTKKNAKGWAFSRDRSGEADALRRAGKRFAGKAARKAAAVLASLVVAASGGGLSTPVHASGVPVVDLAAITQMLVEFQQMLKDYDQMVKQYDMVNDRFNRVYNQFDTNMTGVTGYGRANSTSALLDFLPEALDETLDLIRSRGANALPPGAQQLYREFGLGNACERASAISQARCYRRAALNAMKMYSYAQGEETARARRSAIQNMLDSIDSTMTPKEAADMQQRLLQEQASLQNERMRIEVLRWKFEEEEKLLAMQHQAELDRLFFEAQ